MLVYDILRSIPSRGFSKQRRGYAVGAILILVQAFVMADPVCLAWCLMRVKRVFEEMSSRKSGLCWIGDFFDI